MIVKNTSFGAATDLDGHYKIVFPLDGTYTVMASALNHKAMSKEVRIMKDGSVTVDFMLESDVLSLSRVVVTGVRNPQEKLESAVAITTTTSEEIEEANPRNTADLLKVVPGFYVESSGGEGGNNLFARGIPADGSFRYVAMYEDGLPVFESPELAFANIDLLMRVDETVDRMEALRGGTASIYASNAPGGVINFLSKTGSGAPGGLVKFSTGDYGLFRTDFNYGGAWGEDWRFNVGGFYRQDDGIRDPDFHANQGGQLKANVTRLLDNGYLRFYGKYLNDKNIFYLPIPLTNPDNPEGLEGFDPNYGTMTTSSARWMKVPAPDGQIFEFNLQDGMHPEIKSVGGEFDYDLGSGWTVNNKMRYTDVNLEFNAIFSLDNPFLEGEFAQMKIDEWNAAHPNDQVDDGVYRYRYARGL
ncbi:MAG: Pesticin receptor [Calditrichaeota bacterium]|nr:Pesticin receptor [Calditrichota bacterium]